MFRNYISWFLQYYHNIMNESLEPTPEYKCLLAKLEELLRQYRIAKKNDKNNALQQKVKTKLDQIKSKLRSFAIFASVEDDYDHKIDQAFRETRPQPPPNPKPQRQNVELAKSRQPEPPKKNIGLSSSSNYSSYSSQSNNQLNNSLQGIKKQTSIVQEKVKAPLPVQKPKAQLPSIAKLLKEEPQKIVQSPKPEIVNPKLIEPISDSISSKSSVVSEVEMKKQSSISTIQKNQQLGEKEKSQGSIESEMSFLNQNQSQKGFTFTLKQSPSEEKVQTPQGYLSSESQKEDDFQKLSQASVVENTIDTIVKFCCDNKEKLNTQLLFNEDLFDYIEEEGDFVYLIGVNKPEGKKIQKLYACTIMKFSAQEVFKCDDLFEKETRDYKNNIRTPIGLIIKGENANAVKPEHIKFLINLQCPFIVVLVLKDLQGYDGVLCYFHESALGRIRITPRKQLGQCAEQLNKKTYSLPFNQSFLPKEKTRYVITKHLNRTIATIPEEAPNAITIQNNDCIREEKNQFNYKLHAKFLVSTKPEYAIYYVNNGIVNARIGFKEFQAFKKDALTLQPKVPAIFSVNVPRDTAPIKKEFFDVLVSCNKIRDTSIFLNLNNINTKKTIIITLKSDVTLEVLEKTEPIQYKNFEKDTQISYCLLVIHKNNFKEYEADAKNELIEIKAK